MAHQKNGTGLLLMIVISMIWAGALSQSSSCTNVIISMSPCLNYIIGNSSSPSSGCCTQLASVVRSQPQCLCEVLNGGGSSLGLNINQAQAAALPGSCGVQTPPVSQCNAASPDNSPSGTPRSPNTPSGRGSSDAGSTKLAATLLFFLLFGSSALISTMF